MIRRNQPEYLKAREPDDDAPTINVHYSNGEETTLTRYEYDILKSMGMLWEFHADAPASWPLDS